MGGRCARSSATLDWRYCAPPRGRSGTGSVWHSLSRHRGGQAPLLRPSRPAPIKAQIVWKHLTFFAGDLGLVTLSTLLLGRKTLGRAGLLFALALVAAYFLHFPDALGFYEGRYLYSLLPLVLYGAASAFKGVAARDKAGATGSRDGPAGGGAGAVLLARTGLLGATPVLLRLHPP